MTMHELIKSNKESIVDQVLDLIPQALNNNSVLDVSFCIDGDATVGYIPHRTNDILNDTYFYTIRDCKKPQAGDYDYKSLDSMYSDIEFIEDYYKDDIKDALNEYLDTTYFN